MLERLKDLPGDVDGIRARGKVTADDYEKVLQPILDAARSEGRRIRLLYHFGPEFEGFTVAGAWEDARLGLQYLRLFERCAVVSDVGWIRESSRFVAAMMPCPVKVFHDSEWQDAVTWLTMPTAGQGLTYRLLPEAGVLIVEPTGPLGSEAFDALSVVIDQWIEAHGDLRGVVVHAREFPGWENLGSFLRHLRFIREHHRRVRRVALCADGTLATLAPRLAEHFVNAELRHFAYEDVDRAIGWASQP